MIINEQQSVNWSPQIGAGQSHLLLSVLAVLLSFSAEHLLTLCNENVLCLELPSCRCTAEAPAGWQAQGKPGLESESDPESEPEQPWRPTGPPDDVQRDPETHTSKHKQGNEPINEQKEIER